MCLSTCQRTAQGLIQPGGQEALSTARGGVITHYQATVFDWFLKKFSATQVVNRTSNFSA
jgi:hypothetical protein